MSPSRKQRKCSSAVLNRFAGIVRGNVKIMCSVTKRTDSGMFVSKLGEASDRLEHTITSFSVKKIKTQSTSVRRGRWRRRRIGRVTRSATRRGIGVSPPLGTTGPVHGRTPAASGRRCTVDGRETTTEELVVFQINFYSNSVSVN